jgi:RNA polymerase sigma-70 factor (ECF subfamily)
LSRAAGSFEHNGDQARDSTASGLLDAAKQMDAQAWRELVGRYSWLVFQWCCNAGLNADDAADVVQTVLAQVAVALPNFEKDGKKAAFRRWLRTITRRRIADFYRADAKQPHAEGGSAAEQRILAVADALSSSSSDAPERDALRSRLWRLLDRLEEETEESTWQAFWLTTVENQTSIEAATLLGMTPNAVRLARGRVLQRLREEAALPETDLPELRAIRTPQDR